MAALSQSSEELCCSYNHNRSHKWLSTPSILVRSFVLHCQYPLSLSGACHEDVAASTSRGHAGLSIARCLAVARPKLSGRRSSSTVLSQVCLSLPVFRRQSLGGRQMQAWTAREWSSLMSAQRRWPKKDKRHWRIVSDRSGCPIRDRTTSLETKSVQWIWRMRLRHQLSIKINCQYSP